MTKCHLSWDSYQKNISSGLADLQQHEEFVDMTIAAAGHLVKVHKNLLALASPYIKAMLQSAPCPHPVIFLSNINEETLGHILEYVYTGEVHMPTQKMDAFIKACQDLHIIGVQNVKPPKLPPDDGDKVSNENHQQITKITNNNILTNERLLIESTKAKKRKLDQYNEDLKIKGTADNTALEPIDTNTEIKSVDQCQLQPIDPQDEIVKSEALAKAECLRNMIEQNDATEIEVDLMEEPVAHQSRVGIVEEQQPRVNLVEDSLLDLGLIDSHAVDDDIANIEGKTCDVRKTSDQSVTTAPNSENFAMNVAKKRKFVKKKIIPQQCYILRRSQKKNDDKQKQETETTQALEQVCGAGNESAVISKTIIARKASDIKIKKINNTFRLVTNSKENIPCEAADDLTFSKNINPKIKPAEIQQPTDVSVDFEQSIGTHVIDTNTEIVNLPNNIQDGQLLDPVNDLLFIPTTVEDENITSIETFSHNYIENNEALDTITELPFISTSPINKIDTSNSIDFSKTIETNNVDVNIDIEPSHEYNIVDDPFAYMDVEQSINNEYTDQNSTHATDMIGNTDQNSINPNDIVVKAMNKCKTYEDCVKEFIEETSTNEETVIKDHTDSAPDNEALYNVNVELPSGSQSMTKITVLTSKIKNKYMPMLLTQHIPESEEAESTSKPRVNLPDPNDLITSTAPLFMVNGYSKLQMILNRYIYCIHHTTRQRWRWRCIDYRHLHCRAYVDTVAGNIVGRVNAHKHPFHDKKILKLGSNRQVFSSLKEIEDIVGEPMDKLIYLDLGFLNDLPNS